MATKRNFEDDSTNSSLQDDSGKVLWNMYFYKNYYLTDLHLVNSIFGWDKKFDWIFDMALSLPNLTVFVLLF